MNIIFLKKNLLLFFINYFTRATVRHPLAARFSSTGKANMEHVQPPHDRSSICWQCHPCRTYVVSLNTGVYLWPLLRMWRSPADKRRVDMSTPTTTALDCTAQLLTCSGLALHCTELHYTAMHALDCITLHCTARHYTALQRKVKFIYITVVEGTVQWSGRV